MPQPLYIAPLPRQILKSDIIDLFKDIGETEDVDIKVGKNNAYAFVELKDESKNDQAVTELTDKIVLGMKIAVNLSRGKGSGPGFRGSSDSFKPERVGRYRDFRRDGSPNRSFGGRDRGYGGGRGRYDDRRDRYDDRGRGRESYRRRSRSRTPPRYRRDSSRDRYGSGRGRSRSRSPPRYRRDSRDRDDYRRGGSPGFGKFQGGRRDSRDRRSRSRSPFRRR